MWATFIGSTLAQIPVSGVRKSGMPEGTETPAPVSATVHAGLADQLSEPGGAVEVLPGHQPGRYVPNAQRVPSGSRTVKSREP